MSNRIAERKFEEPVPKCIDWSRELLAGEVAAAGLDTRKRWYACKTGEHGPHCWCKKGAK
jgi:hypothetical protein